MARKNTGTYADNQNYISYADHMNNADQIYLTNSSGVQLTTGDVGVMEVSADKSMTTTTTVGDLRPVVVVPAAITGQDVSASKNIAAAAQDWFFKAGAYVPAANVDGAVAIGDYLKLSGTAKKLTTTGTPYGSAQDIPVGACAIALEDIGVAGQIAVLLIETVTEPTQLFGAALATAQTLKDRMVPYYDEANAQWAVGGNTKYYAPYITKVNTAAEETAFSKTIEGGSVGANGAIVIEVLLFFRNATGAAKNFTLTVKLGGSTIFTGITSIATNATGTHRGTKRQRMVIRNNNDEAVQSLFKYFQWANNYAIDAIAAPTGTFHQHGAAAINLAVDQTLLCTVTMEDANAQEQWYLMEGSVETQYAA